MAFAHSGTKANRLSLKKQPSIQGISTGTGTGTGSGGMNHSRIPSDSNNTTIGSSVLNDHRDLSDPTPPASNGIVRKGEYMC